MDVYKSLNSSEDFASVAELSLVSVSIHARVFMPVISASVARQATYVLNARGPELLAGVD